MHSTFLFAIQNHSSGFGRQSPFFMSVITNSVLFVFHFYFFSRTMINRASNGYRAEDIVDQFFFLFLQFQQQNEIPIRIRSTINHKISEHCLK